MFDDYVFFNRGLMEQFCDFLRAGAIRHESKDHGEEWVVRVPDDLDATLCDQIEAEYDRLFELQSDLTAAEDGDEIHGVGVQFSDHEGVAHQARLDPALVNRLRDCLEYPEIQALVQAVADSLLDNGAGPLCRP